jgi:hypothetical protein
MFIAILAEGAKCLLKGQTELPYKIWNKEENVEKVLVLKFLG